MRAFELSDLHFCYPDWFSSGSKKTEGGVVSVNTNKRLSEQLSVSRTKDLRNYVALTRGSVQSPINTYNTAAPEAFVVRHRES